MLGTAKEVERAKFIVWDAYTRTEGISQFSNLGFHLVSVSSIYHNSIPQAG